MYIPPYKEVIANIIFILYIHFFLFIIVCLFPSLVHQLEPNNTISIRNSNLFKGNLFMYNLLESTQIIILKLADKIILGRVNN